MKPAHGSAGKPIQTGRCLAVGCQHVIKAGFVMCLDHWRLVPERKRLEVLRSARYAGRDEASLAQHRAAVQAAVDAVREKQMKARARSDANTPPLI